MKSQLNFNMKRTVFLLIISIVCVNAFSQTSHKSKSILADLEILPNWQMKDSIETYGGDDLFYYINGGADLYLEYGFDDVSTCKYINYLANNIHIDVYQMNDPAAAFGIFSINSTGHGKHTDLGSKSFLYDYYLDIWKDKFFIRMTANKKDNGMMDTLQLIAKNLDDEISEEAEVPELVSAFKLKDVDFTSVKYVEGAIGLSNVFNFGHGSIAGFKEGVIGKWDDKMTFVFAYENDYKSREWFASAKGKMQMSRKFTDYTKIESGFTVKDKSGNFLSFKPHKRFMLIVKGMNWEESRSVFEDLENSLKNLIP